MTSLLDMLKETDLRLNFTGCERQRNKGMRQARAGFGGLPALNEPLHAIVGAVITLSLQALEQPARGTTLSFREQALGSQSGLQRLLERPKPGRRLLCPAIDRFPLGPAMLADRGAGQLPVTRNRADALLVDQMPAPNFGYRIHVQQPRFSSVNAG